MVYNIVLIVCGLVVLVFAVIGLLSLILTEEPEVVVPFYTSDDLSDINTRFNKEIEKLEERMQRLCKHEQGFDYAFSPLHGYMAKTRTCKTCGLLQSYRSVDNYFADMKAQEIKECEEKLKKLKGDKKCTK